MPETEHQDSHAVWEEHYSAKSRVWSGRVNAQLAAIAPALPAGRALDLGCGEGADALWLAEHGWTVVAVDVSPTALSRARAAAEEAGVAGRIDFEQHDLAQSFPAGTFDLVSAQFLHSTVALDRTAILRRAAAAVAPGGSLLIVDHAAAPPWATRMHHHEFPAPDAVLEGLGLEEGMWQRVRVDSVERTTVGPDGAEAVLRDNVIFLSRTVPTLHSTDYRVRSGVDNLPAGSTEQTIRGALKRRLLRRAIVKGELALPAVPGMLEDYVAICDETFAAFGAEFTEEEVNQLRGVLKGQLEEAYAASPRSDIVIEYESPYGLSVNYHVRAQWFTLEGAYDNWVATREPPLFGTEPDARVVSLAAHASDPAYFPVLDIGAGTGRNSLALARRGHPVDAVEMTEKFADIIRLEAGHESLNVRVIQRDVFAGGLDDLRRDYQLILLSEVVSDFRNVDQLRSVFELAATCLAPGGQLVFNVFLPRDGYTPDDAARELGQQCYTTIFTHPELVGATALLPLDLVADDSVYDYERANLPVESWPPTSWYEGWTSGQDVFDVPRDQSPIEMRWLVYRKASWIAAPTTGNASPSSW